MEWKGGANPSQLQYKVASFPWQLGGAGQARAAGTRARAKPCCCLMGKQGNQAGVQGPDDVSCLMPASS